MNAPQLACATVVKLFVQINKKMYVWTGLNDLLTRGSHADFNGFNVLMIELQ